MKARGYSDRNVVLQLTKLKMRTTVQILTRKILHGIVKVNVRQIRLFSLSIATDLGEGKLRIQTSYTLLKKLTLCRNLSVAEGLSIYKLPDH